MIRLHKTNILCKPALISLAMFALLFILFVRGQVIADWVYLRLGPLSLGVTNGWGLIKVAMDYNPHWSTPHSEPSARRSVVKLKHAREEVVSHSMFWLTDGNPFGIGIRRYSSRVEIELDMGLLFLLAGAIPTYWWFTVRRRRRTQATGKT